MIKKYVLKCLRKLLFFLVEKDSKLTLLYFKIYNYFVRSDKLNLYSIKPLIDDNNTFVLHDSKRYKNRSEVDIMGESKEYISEFDSLNYRVLNSVKLCGNLAVVVKKDDIIYYQHCNFATPSSEINIAPSLILARGKKLGVGKQKNSDLHIDKGIFLGGYWSRNWFHWMIEILSKSVLFEQLPSQYKSWPIIVPEVVLESSNHLESLNYLFPNNSFVYISNNKFTEVNQCIWIDGFCHSPPLYNPVDLPDSPRDYLFNINLLIKYRDNILRILENICTSKILPRRIFLSRGDGLAGSKRPYNEDEIFGLFSIYNFEKVYLERLSLIEQIKLFNKAEFIVGPTGASWTGLLYASSNAKCLCWSPSNLNGASVYSNLALAANCDLRFINYKSSQSSWVKSMRSNEEYYLDKNKVRNAINEWLLNDG